MADWIDEFYASDDWNECDSDDEFMDKLRAFHAAHCLPLTPELAEEISVAVAEYVVSGFPDKTAGCPSKGELKLLVMHMRDLFVARRGGEAGKESETK